MSKGGWRLRIIGKRLNEITDCFHDPRYVFRLHVTPAEFVSCVRAQLRRKLRRAQLGVDRRRFRKLLLLVKRFGLQEFRLVGAFRRRIRLKKRVHFGQERVRIGVVNVNQPLIARVLRFLVIWIIGDDLIVNCFGLLRVAELAVTVCREQHHFRASVLGNLFLHLLVIDQQLRVLTGLKLQTQQPDLRDPAPAPRLRQRAGFLEQRHCFLAHRLVDLAFFRLLKIDREQAGAHCGLGF